MSDGTPLASVIVVCWNSADVIGRCLEHLLAQDYPSYEIVVVDDGSRDRTVEIAEESLGSGKLTIVQSPLNRGCPHARNLGLRHARGEVIAFIDGDGFAAPSWLGRIVARFQADPTVGGVASTVFMEANPLVLNGAGGIVNRQGWAADLCMNVPYQEARLASEVLYPMGCGMAVRRAAVERVGAFDDRMLNYYDDVDYGIRLWRAGYRVVVASDAWIDHGFGHSSGGDSQHKQLLCEQHRMRVVLKHMPASALPRWAVHETLATLRASWPRRELKRKALWWNMRHLASAMLARAGQRGLPAAPTRLMDQSWGEGFPAGVPALVRPKPEEARSRIDMADPEVEQLLPYGWFPREQIHGRSYRWAGAQAAALVQLAQPARRLRIEYAQVPADTGGIDLRIRRLGSPDPLRAAWETTLPWQYIERSLENHPVRLPAGEYEVLFKVRETWSDPPFEDRKLGFALATLGFDDRCELASEGVDMVDESSDEHLVRGWFEREPLGEERGYRWASGYAAVMVGLPHGARTLSLSYCLPPAPTGGVEIAVRSMHRARSTWRTHIRWEDGEWHESRLPVRLPPGDYVVSFKSDATWSNPEGNDPAFPPENRSLGIAVAGLRFDDDVAGPAR